MAVSGTAINSTSRNNCSITTCLLRLALCAILLFHSQTNASDMDDLTTAAECVQRTMCAKRMDTFHVGGASNGNAFAERNCFCDAQCIVYDDCCADFRDFEEFWEAANRHFADRSADKPALTCERFREINDDHEIYIVDACPKAYADRYVRDACAKFREEGESGFFRWPVSGSLSGLLYANVFCAICNGEPNATFWRASLDCSVNPGTLVTSTAGNGGEGLAQFVEVLLSGSREQPGCEAKYVPITNVGGGGGRDVSQQNPLARMCKPTIGQCAKGWTDKKVRTRCRSHASFVYVGDQVYRNVHCAQCNNIDAGQGDDIQCADPNIYSDVAQVTDDAKPFRAILDLNSFQSSIVQDGERDPRFYSLRNSECTSSNEIYDPYAQVCRKLSCATGDDVYEDGECISRSLLQVMKDAAKATSTTTESPSDNNRRQQSNKQRTSTTTASARHNQANPIPTKPSKLAPPTPSSGSMKSKPPYGSSYVNPNCDYVIINATDYVVLTNGSIYLPTSRMVFDSFSIRPSGGGALVCKPTLVHGDMPQSSKTNSNSSLLFMFQFDHNVESLMSIIGIVVSLAALCVLSFVFCCNSPLRTLTGKCLLCLATTLFIAQLGFLAAIHWRERWGICRILAVVEHYFILAVVFWVNAVAIQFSRIVSSPHFPAPPPPPQRFGGRKSGGDCCALFGYALYALSAPACVVGAALTLDNFKWSGGWYPSYTGQFSSSKDVSLPQNQICWMISRNGIFVWFVAPIAVMFIIDFIVFLITCRSMCKRRPEPFVRSLDLSHEEEHGNRKRYDVARFVFIILFAIDVTLTWTFAVAAALYDVRSLLYAFIVCHALQGLLLIGSFLCSARVCQALRGRGQPKKHHQSNGGNSGYIVRRPCVPDNDKIVFKVTSI